MKKMPTIFNRNYEGEKPRVFNMIHPDCEWVFNGEGVATRKWDGTCVMIKDGKYFKRRTVKSKKQPPDDFILMDSDPITGKRFGWIPVLQEDKWHIEGINNLSISTGEKFADGTYELVGPKVQGNAEDFYRHVLIKHTDGFVYNGILRTFSGICAFMKDKDIEGIVFHHPDGRMAKIKKSDYGMERR